MNSVLKKQISLVEPDKDSMKNLGKLTKNFIGVLNSGLRTSGTDAEAFVGGSFARGTLVKQDAYDVDVFVRFDWKYDKISEILNVVLKKVCNEIGLKLERVHGSRDYYKVRPNDVNQRWYFEVIPVTKIKKPSEERNITDLSYFHVPYVKRKIKGLENQVRLAKVFFKAQRVYGAETYVRGFSGYTLELLTIHYKGFLKMLKALSKETGERIVLDMEKHYKKKGDVFIELNESKLNSPIILVDPTYKERNALAALSHETFYKFQEAARNFLKNPSEKFFIEEEIDVEKMKKKAKSKKAEFLHLRIRTNRQEGDIAGTKLRKFSDMMIVELSRYYKVSDYEFDYSGEQDADVYLIGKSRNEVVRIGPPLHLKKFVRAFKKEHMNTYEKNKMIHAKIKINFSLNKYVDVWRKTNKKKIDEMSVENIRIVN